MRSPHTLACLYCSLFVEHLPPSLSSSKPHLSFRTKCKYHLLHKACPYPLNLIMTSASTGLTKCPTFVLLRDLHYSAFVKAM